MSKPTDEVVRLRRELQELETFRDDALEFLAALDLGWIPEAAEALERMRANLVARGHKDARSGTLSECQATVVTPQN